MSILTCMPGWGSTICAPSSELCPATLSSRLIGMLPNCKDLCRVLDESSGCTACCADGVASARIIACWKEQSCLWPSSVFP